MFKKNKAFTLVELIVVITILAVLSTIGFVSYSSYLAGTRDTSRLSQLKAISEWLSLYSTNHSLPTPNTYSINIYSWATSIPANIIATQWYAWKSVLETITYSTEWVDPKDKEYYTYYLTASKKYFQLMAFLEDSENLQIASVLNKADAVVDYSVRFPTVFGDKLWVLTNTLNEPFQSASWSSTWTASIDITTTNLTLKSFLKDSITSVTWTGTKFKLLWDIAVKWGRWYSTTSTGFVWTNLDI